MTALLTVHGEERIKDRIGKKINIDIANKALNNGISHSETTGSLKRYIDSLYFRNQSANNIKIYNYNVYIFVNTLLITILMLPNKYKSTVDKIKIKKKGNI